MFELLVLIFVIFALVYPIYHYFSGNIKSKNGLEKLMTDGLSPDVTCQFKLDGSQVIFDFKKKQIGFANSQFHWKGNTLHGPKDNLIRLTQIKNIDEILKFSNSKRIAEGSNFKTGTIYFDFLRDDGCEIYQATIAYSSQYDAEAAEILEKNWLKMKAA